MLAVAGEFRREVPLRRFVVMGPSFGFAPWDGWPCSVAPNTYRDAAYRRYRTARRAARMAGMDWPPPGWPGRAAP